jgi:hypothetical protein
MQQVTTPPPSASLPFPIACAQLPMPQRAAVSHTWHPFSGLQQPPNRKLAWPAHMVQPAHQPTDWAGRRFAYLALLLLEDVGMLQLLGTPLLVAFCRLPEPPRAHACMYACIMCPDTQLAVRAQSVGCCTRPHHACTDAQCCMHAALMIMHEIMEPGWLDDAQCPADARGARRRRMCELEGSDAASPLTSTISSAHVSVKRSPMRLRCLRGFHGRSSARAAAAPHATWYTTAAAATAPASSRMGGPSLSLRGAAG